MTHATDDRSRARARMTRRALLAMLVGVWAYVSVALNPAGTPAPDDIGLAVLWPCAWTGAYCALPALLAVWAALSSQRLIARLPLVAGIATLIGLMATWGFVRNTPGRNADIDFLLLVFSGTCLQAIALAPLRWRYGWLVRAEESNSLTGRVQFSIGRVLVWTAATAALLGLATWIVSDWDQVGESLRKTRWLGATIGVLVLSLLSLPLVIPGVGLMLSDGRRKWFGVWLAVVAALMTGAAVLLSFGMARATSGTLAGALFSSLMGAAMVAGFLVGLLGSLLVVRLGGFRLVRGAKAPAAAEPAPDEVAPQASEPLP